MCVCTTHISYYAYSITLHNGRNYMYVRPSDFLIEICLEPFPPPPVRKFSCINISWHKNSVDKNFHTYIEMIFPCMKMLIVPPIFSWMRIPCIRESVQPNFP